MYVTAVTPRHLKYVSLVILSLQNAALIIVMRYVRTRPGDMFASTTAVVMTEIFKVIACLVIIWLEEGMSVRGCCSHLNENIVQQPLDCVRVSVPAFIYMIQNNLIYVAASNLDVATFQVETFLKNASRSFSLLWHLPVCPSSISHFVCRLSLLLLFLSPCVKSEASSSHYYKVC